MCPDGPRGRGKAADATPQDSSGEFPEAPPNLRRHAGFFSIRELWGWARRIVQATIGSAHSRENLRSVSRIQAYIAKLEPSNLHRVHRASIVSLLESVGG
jgi:hypothetical protein